MPLYEYNFAEERPTELHSTIVSFDLVGVWSEDICYCTTSFDGTGIIKLDIPQAVIKRIKHGFLKIVPRFQTVENTAMHAEGMQELMRIDIVSRPDTSID
ncbi:MAG: hypothetical protein ABI999_08910 [Acidobacteriota bacterium]